MKQAELYIVIVKIIYRSIETPATELDGCRYLPIRVIAFDSTTAQTAALEFARRAEPHGFAQEATPITTLGHIDCIAESVIKGK